MCDLNVGIELLAPVEKWTLNKTVAAFSYEGNSQCGNLKKMKNEGFEELNKKKKKFQLHFV